jgi:hypothetical protein
VRRGEGGEAGLLAGVQAGRDGERTREGGGFMVTSSLGAKKIGISINIVVGKETEHSETDLPVVVDSSTTRAQQLGAGRREALWCGRERIGTQAGGRAPLRHTLSRFEYQFVILQVNDHDFELFEKINAQQAVYFLPEAP